MRIVNNPCQPLGCVRDDDVAPAAPMMASDDGATAPSRAGDRRLRVGVVGLAQYHVTGWVETLEGFPDELEIVALHDPDPSAAGRWRRSHHDPSLRPGLGEAYRGVPFETSLERLIAGHDLDIALVTLPNADAPAAIERLARGHPPDRRQAGRPVGGGAPSGRRGGAVERRARRDRADPPLHAGGAGGARSHRRRRPGPAGRRRGELRHRRPSRCATRPTCCSTARGAAAASSAGSASTTSTRCCG